jgi:hypothetical protein
MQESIAKKYRPASSADVLHDPEIVRSISAFFQTAQGGHAAIILAPPGSGATTLVELLTIEHDIDVVWTHPGTVRLRALLSAAGQSGISAAGRRKFVVFDGFDAMLSDQSMATDSIDFFKKNSAVPVVCIAHRRRNAVQRLTDAFPPAARKESVSIYEFPALPDARIADRLRDIADAEGIVIDVDLIAENSHGDLRSAIEVLVLGLESATKDEFPDGLEAAAEALAKDPSLQRAMNLYDADCIVVPAAIFENYTTTVASLDIACAISDGFSEGDIFHETAHAKQRYELLEYDGVLTVAQSALLCKKSITPNIKKFGTAWSKSNNRLAKLKGLRSVFAKMRIPVEDLAFVRASITSAPAATARKLRHLHEKDILAIMRQWKCGYLTSHHVRMKKYMTLSDG